MKPDETLAEIFASIQLGNRTRAILDAVAYFLAIADAAFAHPRRQTQDCFFITMLVIEYEKSRHARPLDQQVPLDARADGQRVPARHRGGAADHDPRTDGELREHAIADPPGGVVEIHIDAARAGARDCLR